MQAPPGWYPHPDSPQHDAYWDGAKWTGDYRIRQDHILSHPVAETAQPDPQPDYNPERQQPEFKETLYRPATPYQQSYQSPTQQPAPAPAYRSPRLPLKIAAALVAVVALVVSAVFVTGFIGKSGAATPEEAMRSAVSALENGDFLGLVDVILPSEREMMKDPFIKGVKELNRLGVLDGEASPESQFIKYKMSNMTLRTESVSADVSRVFVSGSMVTEVDSSVKLGPVFEGLPEFENKKSLADLGIEDLAEGSTLENGVRRETTEVKDAMFAAVKYGGRWYLSMGYSLAENIRRESGDPMPAEGIAPTGSKTPEEAVSLYFNNVENLNLSGLISSLHPGEFGALQRYAPMFLNEAQSSVDDFVRENTFSWSVGKLELEKFENSDNKASVRIKNLSISSSLGGETFDVSLSHTGSDITYSVSSSDGSLSGSGSLADAATSDDVLGVSEINPVFWKYAMSLSLRTHQGLWYVAPIATLTDYVFAYTGTLSQQDLRKMLESDSGSLLNEYSSSVPFFSDEVPEDGYDYGDTEQTTPSGSDEIPPLDGFASPDALGEVSAAAKMASDDVSFAMSVGDTSVPEALDGFLFAAIYEMGLSYKTVVIDSKQPSPTEDGWIDYSFQDSSGNPVVACRFAYGPSFQGGGSAVMDYYCQAARL